MRAQPKEKIEAWVSIHENTLFTYLHVLLLLLSKILVIHLTWLSLLLSLIWINTLLHLHRPLLLLLLVESLLLGMLLILLLMSSAFLLHILLVLSLRLELTWISLRSLLLLHHVCLLLRMTLWSWELSIGLLLLIVCKLSSIWSLLAISLNWRQRKILVRLLFLSRLLLLK